jgi:hypothetical protein
VLISLGVILAIAASVSAESNNANASIFSSANDQASVSGRVSASARAGTYNQFDSVYQSSGHECGSFADPNAD